LSNIFNLLWRMRPRIKWRGWMAWPLYILLFAAFAAAVWVGGPMTGVAVFATIWLRAALIGGVIGIFLIVAFVKWRRRRKKAEALEAVLIAEPVGDGKVLAERMQGALATLKKSGGKTYLYDLPWYVIIGPPGAGKTTALKNSGIEFPLAKNDGGVVEGFGGTRYCDWWFAEDAILIDTAGRYTTQDSDKGADEASWTAFLDLLKKSRPNQPINGVILAFSVEDMMNATEETLARHAETVRARLGEIHAQLKIDFPVYVLFTKADLISGFREFFASFNLNRRKLVWGATFQTKDRKAETWQQVPQEYDRLVARLSDEVIDRLSEEPDGVSRIAIFGLPGQLALLRDNVADFLRRVFEPTRYKTNAILRGFYFTSGTQEGTPIDQVLGAMAQNAGGGGFAPAFMSGSGKSFFLHDLLRKVIFAERDWVSHDMKAVRRTAILRGLALSTIAILTIGAGAGLGLSYWNNNQLVLTAKAEAASYERAAQVEIERTQIDDPDLTPVLEHLERLRMQPAGFGTSAEPTWAEGFGLSQRARLQNAATEAYGDALEQMLRPRLILDTELRLPQFQADGDTTNIYRALKVYLLLGKQGGRTDDDAVKAWFDEVWRTQFTGLDGITQREQLARHLDAMLTLGKDRDATIALDEGTVTSARSAIVQMSVADQAWSVILDAASAAQLKDLVLIDQTGPESEIVFATADGSALGDLKVPGLFTYVGFWGFFMDELAEVKTTLENDKWVLGDQANLADFDSQLAGLDIALMNRYGKEFRAAWQAMLDNLTLASMSADKPAYDALAAASAPFTSPILKLAETIKGETQLSQEYKQLEGKSPEEIAAFFAGQTTAQGAEGETAAEGVAGDVASSLGSRITSRSSGLQRILIDAVAANAKSQASVGGGGAGPGDGITRPIEQIEEQFRDWHAMLEGETGQRPIDIVLADLEAIRGNLRLGATNPAQSAAVLPQLLSNLTRQNSRLPDTVAKLVTEAETDFRGEAADATLAEMNRALTNTITFQCRDNITAFYPFANSQRHVPPSEFGKFFGPGGDMDTYFNTYLAPLVIRTDDGLAYDPNNPLAARMNPATLVQFDRAEKIRRAFFGSGGTTPEVSISVTHIDSHPTIESAQLEINGTNVLTAAGDPPASVVWPGQGASATLQIFPGLDRESAIQSREGPWAILRLLRAAASLQSNGSVTRATFEIGGRTITYEFGFNAASNPFTMKELTDFTCPQSLD
jgi:type VI secretion system protein ImpL